MPRPEGGVRVLRPEPADQDVVHLLDRDHLDPFRDPVSSDAGCGIGEVEAFKKCSLEHIT